MVSFKDCVPLFTYVDEYIKVFLFHNYNVFSCIREDMNDPLIWIVEHPKGHCKFCSPLVFGLSFPSEINEESIKSLVKIYYEEENLSVNYYQNWLGMAQILEAYCERGEEVICDGVSTLNLAEKLYEGTV